MGEAHGLAYDRPPSTYAQGASLSKRFAGWGMGADRADVSGGAPGWSATHDVSAHGDGRDFVHWVERLRLGDVAQMLSADLDGAWLFLRLAGQRTAGDDQSSAGD